jgi:membrane protease YdiL (CAAX protease family)
VTVNLTVGSLLGVVAVGVFGSSPRELGFHASRWGVVAAAGAAAVALAAPLYLLALFESSASLVADERAADLSASEVAFEALVRIPFGTALFEEFAFRGVLFGLFARRGKFFGTIASSAAFGLWHIRPTIEVVDANALHAQAQLVTLLVVGAVVVTGVAGLAFCWLRIRGGGIWAPAVLHAAVNSLSLVAAVVAHARQA